MVLKEQITSNHAVSSALSLLTFPPERIRSWSHLLEPFFKNMQTTMLREQYRMHPVLSQWPSKQFYGGELKDATNVHRRKPPSGIPWVLMKQGGGPKAAPLLFVATLTGREETNPSGTSKLNMREAQVTLHRFQSRPCRPHQSCALDCRFSRKSPPWGKRGPAFRYRCDFALRCSSPDHQKPSDQRRI